MTGVDVVKASLTSTKGIFEMYFADFSDDDLFVRPVPSANHTAWQLGHLIMAERAMVVEQLPLAPMPALPDGFAEAHNKARAKHDGKEGFYTKAEYSQLFNDIRTATIAAVEKLTDADLDQPSKGSMAPWAPRLGDFMLLIANHSLMHGAQFTVVRRALGKPVLM
jgi:hypothetical protein